MSSEADKKKGYVKLIMILICVAWDWQVVQNVSAILKTKKIRLMEFWQYVCDIHGENCWNILTIFFEGQNSKIIEIGCEVY